LEGLPCKPQPLSSLPEFTGVQINFKVGKHDEPAGLDGLNHGNNPPLAASLTLIFRIGLVLAALI